MKTENSISKSTEVVQQGGIKEDKIYDKHIKFQQVIDGRNK